MTHDIYLYIQNRQRVPDRQIAKDLPGREHDVLHLISLRLIRVILVNGERCFRSN